MNIFSQDEGINSKSEKTRVAFVTSQLFGAAQQYRQKYDLRWYIYNSYYDGNSWVTWSKTNARIENPLSAKIISRVDNYLNKIETRELTLSLARSADPVVPNAGVIQRGEEVFRIDGDGVPLTIVAPSLSAANLFATQLEMTAANYHGGIWALIDVMVEAEIDWPAWRLYMAHVLRLGDKARAGKPRLFEQSLQLTKSGDYSVEEYWRQNELYAGVEAYMPEEVPASQYFEYPIHPFRQIALALRAVPPASRCEYIKKAMNSDRIVARNACPFDDGARLILEQLQLLVPGGQAELSELFRRLPQSALYQPIKQLGLKPEAYAVEAYIEFYRRNLDNYDLLQALRAHVSEIFFLVQPPKPLNWQQFQMFRQQLKWMGKAILDWRRGCIHDSIAGHLLRA